MKNIKAGIILFIALFIFNNTSAQTLTDVARSKSITWYGVDFSIARFMGFKNTKLSDKIPQKWCYTDLSNNQINYLENAYGKGISVNTSKTATKDDSIKCQSLMTDKAYFLDIDKIKKVVSDYKFSGTGFGLLFIVESVEKVSNSIFIWVVYIDNSTGQIISTRRYTGTSWGKDGRHGAYYSDKGIKLIIKLSAKELKQYKN